MFDVFDVFEVFEVFEGARQRLDIAGGGGAVNHLTPKFQRKDPKIEKEGRKCGGRREKKREIWGSTLQGLLFLGLGLHPSGEPHSSGPHPLRHGGLKRHWPKQVRPKPNFFFWEGGGFKSDGVDDRFFLWRSADCPIERGQRRRAQHCRKQWNSSVSATMRWQRQRDVSRFGYAKWQGRMVGWRVRVGDHNPPQTEQVVGGSIQEISDCEPLVNRGRHSCPVTATTRGWLSVCRAPLSCP